MSPEGMPSPTSYPKAMIPWSWRFSPTPLLSTITSMPWARRRSASPMPESSNSWGVWVAPAARMASLETAILYVLPSLDRLHGRCDDGIAFLLQEKPLHQRTRHDAQIGTPLHRLPKICGPGMAPRVGDGVDGAMTDEGADSSTVDRVFIRRGEAEFAERLEPRGVIRHVVAEGHLHGAVAALVSLVVLHSVEEAPDYVGRRGRCVELAHVRRQIVPSPAGIA